MPATGSNSDYISRSRACRAYGLTNGRLRDAIKAGDIRVRYVGRQMVRVHREDCELLLSTPPTKASSTFPQQAA